MFRAAYRNAYESGELLARAAELLGGLESCELCPRRCGVNRLRGEKGFCRTGRLAAVSSYGPHFGEERPLVGEGGSGTIFFTHCNLRCCFCQNYEISHLGQGVEVRAEGLARLMVGLQEQGCHNVNLVSPSHVVAQIVEALPLAVEAGLRVPLVYNTGGYDLPRALRALEGIVDIYMPDFKVSRPEAARDLAEAPDYPEVARDALREMHRQVGDLAVGPDGLALRGLLVRHLVLPGGLAGTGECLGWIATHLSQDTYVNVMDQYRPCGTARRDSRLSHGITPEEFREAVGEARRLGLNRLDST
jgi:putative pyruvate formate lyase activating enzyme